MVTNGRRFAAKGHVTTNDHAHQLKVKFLAACLLANQTWQTEWKTAPSAKVKLCEYEN